MGTSSLQKWLQISLQERLHRGMLSYFSSTDTTTIRNFCGFCDWTPSTNIVYLMFNPQTHTTLHVVPLLKAMWTPLQYQQEPPGVACTLGPQKELGVLAVEDCWAWLLEQIAVKPPVKPFTLTSVELQFSSFLSLDWWKSFTDCDALDRLTAEAQLVKE